jgi:hypothetical protein
MLWARVPEAAVDEDRQSLSGKNDVCLAPAVEREWMLNPEAKASTM